VPNRASGRGERAGSSWQRLLEALQAEADAARLIDWDLHVVASSFGPINALGGSE
jgi:hypothetical protein